MTWKAPIPMTSVLLLSFLLVLSGPALEGCQSASVGDTSGAKPPENAEHESSRVYKNAGKLSDKDPGHRFDDYGDVDEEEHRDKREEDYEYDHEAFLGAEDAHEFDDLDPEESKRKLSDIVDKIDVNSDQLITHEEMRNWILYIFDRYMPHNTEAMWKELTQDGNNSISWEAYSDAIYGILDDMKDFSDDISDEDEAVYRKLEQRDMRRWNLTDENQDGTLSKIEFNHFMHPEEFEKTKYIVVMETLDDLDQDGDGQISVDEYIEDLTKHMNLTDKAEPQWVIEEREGFGQMLDHDKNGKLDKEEIKQWILPNDVDHIALEAQHLIEKSDTNGDNMLTKAEILDKYKMFVGSGVTYYGVNFTRNHDEL